MHAGVHQARRCACRHDALDTGMEQPNRWARADLADEGQNLVYHDLGVAPGTRLHRRAQEPGQPEEAIVGVAEGEGLNRALERGHRRSGIAGFETSPSGVASDQPTRICCTGAIPGTPMKTLFPSFARYALLGVIQSWPGVPSALR